MRAVGSGNRHLDNDGEPDQETNLPLHRPPAARRARFVSRRRLRRDLSRSVLASLSVPRFPSNYNLSACERWIRGVVFRGHTRCREHFKCHADRAFFRDTRLEYGPAHQPAPVLASDRWSERDGAFKPHHDSTRLSVIFVRDNASVKTDSAVPYDWTFTTTNLGPHVLHVTPYSSTNGAGIAGATFDAAYTVVRQTPTPTPAPTATPTPTQTPTPSATPTPTPAP